MKTFSEFWPFYCREHRNPLTRNMHFIGSILGPVAAATIFIRTGSGYAFWLWPACGYGFAWFAHIFVEENRPATFTYPFYSLASDYVMVWKMLLGKMDEEVSKALRTETEATANG